MAPRFLPMARGLTLCLTSCAVSVACQEKPEGIVRTNVAAGGAGAAESGGPASGGGGGPANDANLAVGAGGTAAPGASTGDSDATSRGSGGTSVAGAGGAAEGSGGDGSPGTTCTFHTAASGDPSSGGEAGAGSLDVHIENSDFLGDYLTDALGLSLYIYGADYPGDCNDPPLSNCHGDCLLSWPLFDAGARTLGEGLSDEAFGSITRTDGLQQTTYMGWPLYYYIRDEAPGDLVGHGRGSIWFAAETVLPNVMVMRASEENGGIRYLATERGFTLYAHDADTLATAQTPPESACQGSCLDDFVPLSLSSLRPASPIEPAEITVFVRSDDGTLQVAYRGAPLYTSRLDDRSGELQGASRADWSVVEL